MCKALEYGHRKTVELLSENGLFPQYQNKSGKSVRLVWTHAGPRGWGVFLDDDLKEGQWSPLIRKALDLGLRVEVNVYTGFGIPNPNHVEFRSTSQTCHSLFQKHKNHDLLSVIENTKYKRHGTNITVIYPGPFEKKPPTDDEKANWVDRNLSSFFQFSYVPEITKRIVKPPKPKTYTASLSVVKRKEYNELWYSSTLPAHRRTFPYPSCSQSPFHAVYSLSNRRYEPDNDNAVPLMPALDWLDEQGLEWGFGFKLWVGTPRTQQKFLKLPVTESMIPGLSNRDLDQLQYALWVKIPKSLKTEA